MGPSYKDGEEAKVGDKVLGDKVKGRVAEVKDGKVVVVMRGPWTPKGKEVEVRVSCDPADLILISRAPEPSKR